MVPVLPTEPVTATIFAFDRARDACAEIVQRGQHVIDDQQRCVLRHRVALRARDDRKPCAGLERRLDEIMPVAVLALNGEERLAGFDGARVDRQPRHFARQSARTLRLHGGGHGIEGPERLAHPAFSLSAAATASWSLNGNTRSPTIWPLSWPFPATSRTSPGCNAATALRIASPRSPISARARRSRQNGRPDRGRILAARIVVGDDDRVGVFCSDFAHQRPLALIAVAAAAEHHDELALRIRPQRFERLGERIRLVRVVDEDGRAVALADQLEPAFRAFQPLERGEDLCGIASRRERQAGRDQRVLHLERADQRQPHAKRMSVVLDAQRLRKTVDRGIDAAGCRSRCARPSAPPGRAPPRRRSPDRRTDCLPRRPRRRPARRCARTGSASPRDRLPRSRDNPCGRARGW